MPPLPVDTKAYFLLIAEGDRNAFKVIFDLYKESFYSAAYKMTRSAYASEEIVQEVFILLWTKRALVAKAENPSKYLLSVLYNCIYAQFNKIASENKMRREVLQQAIECEDVSMESLLEVKENRMLWEEVISQLPPQQQIVYKLSKQQGLSRNEIASSLHISPHSVKNHLQDAVKSIRLYFRARKEPSTMILLFLIQFL
ncbi:MAG: sigma-70 family RNA polymerase sigma factor [Flavitalea sp.]